MINESKAKEKIEQIVDEEEYQAYYQNSEGLLVSLWEKVKEWLLDLLVRLFPSLNPTSDTSTVLLIVLIVLFVGVLLLVLFTLSRNKLSKRRFHQNKPLENQGELHWSFQKHQEEADVHANQRSFSLATRHLFLALLLYFDEKQWLQTKIWKTNWEYYEELRKVNQIIAEKFYRLALLFDEVAYGEHTVTEEEFRQFQAQVMEWLVVEE
ncbi:DUF4129 domain-containing protein [Bacillus sp. 2205SS5-2]|uniref:DUF4129 domain-containing protein n=1 Tax=Bacillus sp. 2205SS5-2 TaxID=3109031 RepID=UPI00300790DD